MSEYESAVFATVDALHVAIERGDRTWSRADALALAQVHATLAMAAAFNGIMPPVRIVEGVKP